MPKLVRISSSYSSYLETFLKKNPELSRLTYREQKNLLDQDANAWADFWGNALEPLGYETNEFILNFSSAQKKWAEENGLPGNLPLLDIIRRQVIRTRPEVLFVNDYTNFSRKWITELRESCPSIRLVLGWCGAPFRDPDVFKAYDIVLSCIPDLVTEFSNKGHRSFHLAHAFDPRVLERVDMMDKNSKYEFTFIGQIIREDSFHAERERILSLLVRHIPVEIFSPSGNHSIKERLLLSAKQNAYRLTQSLRTVGFPERGFKKIPILKKTALWGAPPYDPTPPFLKDSIHPPVYGLEMFKTLKNSKLTFNNHIGLSSRSASNMRLFEATGMGTCLVTDWKEDLSRYFEPNEEVVTFKTPEECLEKVKWLLNNPAERAEIARRGQTRTLSEHNFSKRAKILNQYILQGLR